MKNVMIGRDKEFKSIINIIESNQTNKHLIVIIGGGGSGKTMMLNSIYKYFDDEKRWIVPFDFRDIYAQSVFGLNFYNMKNFFVANSDNPKANIFSEGDFSNFISKLYSNEKVDNSYLTFIEEAFEKLSNYQILIIEDTLESVNADSDYIPTSFQIGSKLPNCIAVIATRPKPNAIKNIKIISQILKSDGWIIHEEFKLSPFSEDDIYNYLKQSSMKVKYLQSLSKSLYYLTEGNPVILAIAYEWAMRNGSLHALCEKLLGNKTLYYKEEVINEFKFEILSDYRNPSCDEDWVILLLALLNKRYDRTLFCSILNIRQEKMEQIEKNVSNYRFMREYIIKKNELLHDEMQELLVKYAWNFIDGNFTLREKIIADSIEVFYTPIIAEKINFFSDNTCKSVSDFMDFWDYYLQLVEFITEKLDLEFNIITNTINDKNISIKTWKKETKNTIENMTKLVEESMKSYANVKVIEYVMRESINNLGIYL